MKRIAITALILGTLLTGNATTAKAHQHRVNGRLVYSLTGASMESLSVAESRVRVGVSYPGNVTGGICGVEFRTLTGDNHQALQAFFERVNIDSRTYSPITLHLESPNVAYLDFGIAKGSLRYIEAFSIRTKDGSSLSSTIGSIMAQYGYSEHSPILMLVRYCRPEPAPCGQALGD